MRLIIDVEMDCTLAVGDAALLMLEVAEDDAQKVLEMALTVQDGTLHRPKGAHMVWADVPGPELVLRYSAVVEMTRPVTDLSSLHAGPTQDLPGAVLPYLRPSRYCQSDLFTDLAQQQFGALEGGAKVLAMRDWVAEQLDYVPASSTGTTTAVDTFAARKGVCRDFAHLLCALARAAQIPARYASVYGAEVTPQDIHAVVQVWLEGAWHPVDATNMGPVHEMAVIATGRDAADVAVMETAQWAQLHRQHVSVTRS